MIRRFLYLFTLIIITLAAYGLYRHYFWHPHLKPNNFIVAHKSKITSTDSIQSYFFCDFENDIPEYSSVRSGNFAHSGKYSILLDDKTNYSAQLCNVSKDVTKDTLKMISASAWIYSIEDDPDLSLVLAIVDANGIQIYWNEKNIKRFHFSKNKWLKINAGFNFSPNDYCRFQPSDNICMYLWNKSSAKIYTDDFEIVYGKENNRIGNEFPVINLQSPESLSFKYDKYKPPFPFLFFQKEIVDVKNTDIVNDDRNSELFPDDNIIIGNLIGDSKDEIARLKNNNFEIYSFSEVNNKFTLSGYFRMNNSNSSSTRLLTGDLDGDGKNELLTLSDSANLIRIYKFKPSIEFLGDYSTINIIPDKDIFIACGDYDNDKLSEIFIAGCNSGNYKLLSCKNGNFIVKAEGKLNPSCFNKNVSSVSGKFFHPDGGQDLLIAPTNENKSTFTTLHYNPTLKLFQFEKHNSDINFINLFGSRDKFMKVSFNNSREDELLVFSKKNRFEMKLIDADKNGFFVKGMMDFSSDNNNENPKYYEFPLFLSGKFLNASITSLMCILRNCDDKDFNGIHCSTYSDIPYLPNKIEFYTIPN